MKKSVKKSFIFGVSMWQISLLVGMIFAFAFMLNLESEVISAQTPTTPKSDTKATSGISGAVSNVFKGQVFRGGGPGGVTSFIDAGTTYTWSGTDNAWLANDEMPAILGSDGVPTEATNIRTEFATTGTAGFANSLIQGLAWGMIVGGALYMIGGMFGVSKENQANMFKAGLFGGVAGGITKWAVNEFSTKVVGGQGTFLGGSAGTWGIGIGLATTAAIIIFGWKETKTEVVTFICMPWEAPLGGKNCEKCNTDPMRPCSEYRCKSLGQGCEIVNKGTEKEQCIWVTKSDVNSPIITPWIEPLNKGLAYTNMETRPPSLGTKIIRTGTSKCLEAYTPLRFGLTTNEPAQCKLDYTYKNYSDMKFFFGGSNYYERNHTQIMKLPSASSDSEEAPLLKNDGTMQLWIQCQDANGNLNVDSYVVEFCVDKSPDTTPPVIETFSIESGSFVRYNVDKLSIDAYLNEIAQCKWSRDDKSYENMENQMTCSTSGVEINGNMQYTCNGELTAIKDREDNNFFFRCIDSSGNKNMESKKLVLKGSQPLNIIAMSPNQTVYGGTTTIPVTISVTTDAGADSGKAVCYYSGDLTSGYNEMYNTGSYLSTQTLDLVAGDYEYSIKCVDSGGNIDEDNLTFEVVVDTASPKITRVYRDEALKIVTNEDAECSYSIQSCTFVTEQGIKMEYSNVNVNNQLFAPWNIGVTYYIRCVDAYGNQPSPGECSAVVSPRALSLERESDIIGTIGTIL